MATAADFVDRARRYIGAKGRPNTFTRWYAARHGSAYLNAPWCAIFATYVAYGAKVKGVGEYAYCPYWVRYFKDEKRWGSTPKAGALVFFDWNRDKVADHVGIVEYVKGSTIYTIEGNKGDQVCRVERKPADVIGYGYPIFDKVTAKTYTVKAGDNLSKIAAKHYGDPNQWPKIYEANKKAIGPNPSLIKIGLKLTLP